MRYPSHDDERLSPADASNMVIDAPDQVNSIMLAGLLGCAGFVGANGEANLDRLRAVLVERIEADPELRRFAQRVVRQGRHLVWRASEPDMAWHVRQTEVVAGRPGLAAVCARLTTSPFPTDRPLWELLIVPGAGADQPRGTPTHEPGTPTHEPGTPTHEPGTPTHEPATPTHEPGAGCSQTTLADLPGTAPGIVLRVHHAVADGAAGVRLVQRLFDNPPSVAPARSACQATEPESANPTRATRATRPTRPTERRRSSIRAVLRGITRIRAILGGDLAPTVLLGPIGRRRGVVFSEVGLAELRQGARTAGGTVNDALLAAVVEAAAATLRAMGEQVPTVLPASVPVALPARGDSGNAVGVMLVPLPTGIDDPAARIVHIARITGAAKPGARAAGTLELTRSGWGTRLFGVLARRQRLVAFFVTNVRGPDEPLRLAGAALEAVWPLTPIQGNVRLGVSAFSYAGRLACAAHLDAAALDQAVLARALTGELDRIVALGRRPS